MKLLPLLVCTLLLVLVVSTTSIDAKHTTKQRLNNVLSQHHSSSRHSARSIFSKIKDDVIKEAHTIGTDIHNAIQTVKTKVTTFFSNQTEFAIANGILTRIIPRYAYPDVPNNAGRLPYDPMISYDLYQLARAATCVPTSTVQSWNFGGANNFPIAATDHKYINSYHAGATDDFVVLGISNVNGIRSIFVSFRSTQSLWNWVQDFEISKVTNTLFQGKIHKGFSGSYNSLRQFVTSNMPKLVAACPGCRIYTTGHSLGGALSTLAAADLHQLGYKNIQVYNYGSPRVGDLAWANWYNSILGAVTIRVTFRNDPIPQAPLTGPNYDDYNHVGSLIWYPTDNTYKICANFLAPGCTRSQNVLDHGEYLGSFPKCPPDHPPLPYPKPPTAGRDQQVS